MNEFDRELANLGLQAFGKTATIERGETANNCSGNDWFLNPSISRLRTSSEQHDQDRNNSIQHYGSLCSITLPTCDQNHQTGDEATVVLQHRFST